MSGSARMTHTCSGTAARPRARGSRRRPRRRKTSERQPTHSKRAAAPAPPSELLKAQAPRRSSDARRCSILSTCRTTHWQPLVITGHRQYDYRHREYVDSTTTVRQCSHSEDTMIRLEAASRLFDAIRMHGDEVYGLVIVWCGATRGVRTCPHWSAYQDLCRICLCFDPDVTSTGRAGCASECGIVVCREGAGPRGGSARCSLGTFLTGDGAVAPAGPRNAYGMPVSGAYTL